MLRKTYFFVLFSFVFLSMTFPTVVDSHSVHFDGEETQEELCVESAHEQVSEASDVYLVGSRTCPVCKGSGNCTECHGSGKCKECGGSGYRDRQHKQRCRHCSNGKCPHCYHGHCPNCAGHGTVN